MEIVEQIVGTYIPLCCLSLPVLGFFALVALLPVAFFSMTAQGRGDKRQGAKGREQGVGSKE